MRHDASLFPYAAKEVNGERNARVWAGPPHVFRRYRSVWKCGQVAFRTDGGNERIIKKKSNRAVYSCGESVPYRGRPVNRNSRKSSIKYVKNDPRSRNRTCISGLYCGGENGFCWTSAIGRGRPERGLFATTDQPTDRVHRHRLAGRPVSRPGA